MRLWLESRMIAKIETHFQGNLAAIATTGLVMPDDIGVKLMYVLFARFLESEDGAVTIDWVVLTGFLCAFGVLVATVVTDGATDASTGLGAQVGKLEVTKN